MEELRRFKRVAFSGAVQYRTTPWGESKGCLACDFSIGGIRLRVDDFIALNTDLFMDVALPTRNAFQVSGRVAWVQRVPHSESYQVGVEFRPPDKQPR